MWMNRFTDSPLAAGVEEIRKSWGWFLALGIVLMLFGAVCVAGSIFTTFATVLFFGWFLLLSGVFALVHAFRMHTRSSFLLYLVNALLGGVTGYLLIRYPAAGAASITMILALFFVAGGLFRAMGSAALQLPRWGWSVFSGLVSVLLGVLLLAQWPASGVWFIGFAIGVEMVFDGAALTGLAMAMHSSPKWAPSQAKAA